MTPIYPASYGHSVKTSPGTNNWSYRNTTQGAAKPGQSYYQPPRAGGGGSQQPSAPTLTPPMPVMSGFNQWGVQQDPMHVQTSITPTDVYSPQQTQAAVNQAQSHALRSANPAYLKHWLDGRGSRRGIGYDAAVAPQVAQGRMQGAVAGAEIPFADAAVNASHRLSGESAREQEAQALATGAARMQDDASSYNQSNQMALLRMLGGLMGGV